MKICSLHKDQYLLAGLFIMGFCIFKAMQSDTILYNAELFAGLVSGVLVSLSIPAVNQYYFQHIYRGISLEKLTDSMRFLSDTTVAVLLGIFVADVELLPLFFLLGDSLTHSGIFCAQFVIILFVLCYTAIYHTVFYIKLYVERNVQLERIAKEKLNTEILSLQAQFCPKLIYNTLDKVESLIAENRPVAQSILDNFSKVLRYKIYEIKKPLIHLDQELDYLELYCRLLDSIGSVRIAICVEPSESELHIKPMMLQTAADTIIQSIRGCCRLSISTIETESFFTVNYSVSGELCQQEIKEALDVFIDGNRHWATSMTALISGTDVQLNIQFEIPHDE